MKEAYRYILRYYIDPGFHEEERIVELVSLCRRGRIAEVMFFHNPEELFRGYPPEEENERWIALACKVKAALSQIGVEMSVNPWVTTVHLARGRRLPEGLNFRRMVGETGAEAPMTACPLSREWQTLLCGWFARIAGEVAPTAIWVEDDWRLHNHEPAMGWGGCFCDGHLRLFSSKIGRRNVAREELLREITVNGNLEWRRVWLDLSRETLRLPAEELAEAVRKANPATRLGLMSSGPDTHSAEGRDWGALADALSPGKPLLLRPHLPPYTEQNPLMTPQTVARQAAAELPPERTELYPELENSPRCGLFSKSHAYSAWECLLSPLYGSRGITVNPYDMMGNGLALDRAFPEKLAALRPRLDALAALKLTEHSMQGPDVLFSAEVAGSMKCAAPRMSELVNNSVIWGDVLTVAGISCRVVRQASDRPVCVCGQTLRAFSDGEISELLRGTLLLDGESAAILAERGFGPQCGIGSAEKRPQEEDGFAYEEIAEDDPSVYGLARPRLSASRCADYVYRFELGAGCAVLSTLYRYDRRALYPGMTRFRNDRGGTVIALPYPFGRGQFFMGFFNPFRAALLRRVIGREMRTPFAAALRRPMFTYLSRCSAREYLLTLANPSCDTLTEAVWELKLPEIKEFRFLRKDGKWAKCRPERQDGCWKLSCNLPPLETLSLKCLLA